MDTQCHGISCKIGHVNHAKAQGLAGYGSEAKTGRAGRSEEGSAGSRRTPAVSGDAGLCVGTLDSGEE